MSDIDVHLPGFCITRCREMNRRERSFEMHPVCFEADRSVLVVPQKSDTDPEAFANTTGILKKLQHPGIPACTGGGTWGGLPYRILSWFPEEDLVMHIARTGPLSLAETVAAIERIANALDHAHDVGVIHGNLHPRSIRCGEPNEYWLTDFGHAPTAVGSVHELAPERTIVPDEALRPQTDVYPLAEIAYFMMTGQFVFAGDMDDWLPSKYAGVFHKASAVRSDVPATVDLVLQHALMVFPELRFQRAGHFAHALRVAVRPVQPLEPIWMTDHGLTEDELFDRAVRILIDPTLSDGDFFNAFHAHFRALFNCLEHERKVEKVAPLLPALPRILNLIASDMGTPQDHVIEVLGALGEPCVGELRSIVSPERGSMTMHLAALARCGYVADVAEVLAHYEDPWHQRSAALALSVAPSAQAAVEALRPGLADNDPNVREAVAEVLVDRVNDASFDWEARLAELNALRALAKKDEVIRTVLQKKNALGALGA